MFKAFPEFSKLKERAMYDLIVKAFPPISDITFTSLQLWWNHLDSLVISRLNGNLVISYWLPGDEVNSGLSLIGTNKVDESICIIFDHLRDQGRPTRLVHVPEFVVSHIQYPQLFNIVSERDYDEYIIPVSNLTPLESVMGPRRRRIKRALADIGEDTLEVCGLDLHDERNRQKLLKTVDEWQQAGIIKGTPKLEDETVQDSLTKGAELGVRSICLFIRGELAGFCLYHLPHDKRYAIVVHVKVDHTRSFILDLMAHVCATHLAEQGVSYLNFEMDLGKPGSKNYKLILGPTNFFRKYSIEAMDRGGVSWTMLDYF